MSEVTLKVNGVEVKVEEGTSLIEVARQAKANVPSLCYNRKLSPFGACRVCMVEVTKDGRSKLVASCVYPAEEGIEVQTESERVVSFRKGLLELMLAAAPEVKVIQNYARRYGVEQPRFTIEKLNMCVLCGLCVRYCAEIKQAYAIGFQGRGTNRQVTFVPQIAPQICPDCRECFSVCPTRQLSEIYREQIESPPQINSDEGDSASS